MSPGLPAKEVSFLCTCLQYRPGQLTAHTCPTGLTCLRSTERSEGFCGLKVHLLLGGMTFANSRAMLRQMRHWKPSITALWDPTGQTDGASSRSSTKVSLSCCSLASQEAHSHNGELCPRGWIAIVCRILIMQFSVGMRRTRAWP